MKMFLRKLVPWDPSRVPKISISEGPPGKMCYDLSQQPALLLAKGTGRKSYFPSFSKVDLLTMLAIRPQIVIEMRTMSERHTYIKFCSLKHFFSILPT